MIAAWQARRSGAIYLRLVELFSSFRLTGRANAWVRRKIYHELSVFVKRLDELASSHFTAV